MEAVAVVNGFEHEYGKGKCNLDHYLTSQDSIYTTAGSWLQQHKDKTGLPLPISEVRRQFSVIWKLGSAYLDRGSARSLQHPPSHHPTSPPLPIASFSAYRRVSLTHAQHQVALLLRLHL